MCQLFFFISAFVFGISSSNKIEGIDYSWDENSFISTVAVVVAAATATAGAVCAFIQFIE